MPVVLSDEQANAIIDALDVSMDNIELDRLNDDEDEFAEMEKQVGEARDLMVTLRSEKRQFGVIRVTGGGPESETAYTFTYKKDSEVEKLLDEAFAEMKANAELVALVREQYTMGNVRDLCCEMDDGPFNRRGIQFVSIWCDYEIDGTESLGEDE